MAQPFTLFDGPGTGRYMLNVGAPPPHLLKRFAELMRDITPKRLADEQTPEANGRLMQYGTPCGDPRFLNYLCEFLREQYRDDVKKENLVQTAGASTALVIMLTQLFPSRCTIYCEQLSYFLAIEVFQNLGFMCKSVRSEADGLNLKHLEEQLSRDMLAVEDDREAGRYSAAVYLVPTYQNPTGTILAEEKCRKIVELARKYNVLIFCDDVYNIFNYDGVVRKRLFAYDNPTDADYGIGHVISNGTFSKLLSPGLRLGWMELPSYIRKKFWALSPIMMSGGSMNTYTGGLVAELLHSGAAKEHIDITRQEQKEKMAAAVEILEHSLPSTCKLIEKSKGGYFIFVHLPTSIDSTNVVSYLREKHDILVIDGKRFLVGDKVDSDPVQNGIRLSIAYVNINEVRESVKILCQALSELCK